jgi:hypothetical protein
MGGTLSTAAARFFLTVAKSPFHSLSPDAGRAIVDCDSHLFMAAIRPVR